MWFDYQPPKKPAIDEIAKRLENNEVFPGESPRIQKMLARIKACSLISMCPETVDLIFDVIDKYYSGTKFHQSQLDDLKQTRYDVYLAIEKYIKQGKIGINESRVGIAFKPLHKQVNVPRKRKSNKPD